jgi:phosphatidylinositol glycan class V
MIPLKESILAELGILSYLPSSWGTIAIPPTLFPYTSVQSKYWNVGFLKFWTFQQLPNFLMAAPVLLWAVYGLGSQFTHKRHFLEFRASYYWLQILLCLIAIFSMHINVFMRMASCLPLIFCTLSSQDVYESRIGKTWVLYSLTWSSVGAVLFALFYPPA